MMINLPPKSQTLGTLRFVCSAGNVMKVRSFGCLFLFWLDRVRLGVSPRARRSHYGRGNLLLMAAICCTHRAYEEQRPAVQGKRAAWSGLLTRLRGRANCVALAPRRKERSPPTVLRYKR